MRRRLRRAILIIAGLLVLAVGALWVRLELYLSQPIDPAATEPLVVRLPRGGFEHVAEVLSYYGLVTEPELFKLHAGLSGHGRRIKAGIWFLDPRWTPRELLRQLAEGPPPAVHRLQLPEGLNVWQIAGRVEAAEAAERGAFLALAQDWALAKELGLPARRPDPARWPGLSLDRVPALEGYLFPLTYPIPWDAGPRDVVATLAAEFREQWRAARAAHPEGYRALSAELGLSDHDFVTLASLVEKETGLAEERAVVASVFYNRLRKGMLLQTDPTLVYHPEHWEETPAPRHRKDRSNPYNTYAWKGLPPGPIASPGRGALEAVLAPATTEFLFFVARSDGQRGHVFSRTFEEHDAHVRRLVR